MFVLIQINFHAINALWGYFMFLLLQGLKFVNPSGCFYIDNRSCCWWPFYWLQSTTNLKTPLKLHLISPWVDTDIEVKIKHQKCIGTKWWELRTACGRNVWTRRHMLWLADDVTSVWTCPHYRTNRGWWCWGSDRRQGKGFVICIPCQNITVIK
jgi:hypothetical protein